MPPSQGLDSLANLRNSLPNGNLALKEEQDLMNNFKGELETVPPILLNFLYRLL